MSNDAELEKRQFQSSCTQTLELTNSTAYIIGYADDFGDSLIRLCEKLDAHIDDRDSVFRHLEPIVGAFAVAIVSRRDQSTLLFCDPLGLGRAYYSQSVDRNWHWGFSLKEMKRPDVCLAPSWHGVSEFFFYRWLCEQHSLLDGVSQLLPGQCAYLEKERDPRLHRYAELLYTLDAAETDLDKLIESTDTALERYMTRAAKRHRRAAVFLSGGVDSSLILAKAKKAGFEQLYAVTAEFSGYPNPELDRAKRVAALLGVEHRIVALDDAYVASNLSRLTLNLENPISYMNNFIRMLLFESTAPDVDFVIVGEGADGQFGHDVGLAANATRFTSKQAVLHHIPKPLRHCAAMLARQTKTNIGEKLDRLLSWDTEDYLLNLGAIMQPGTNKSEIMAEDLVPALQKFRADPNTRPYLRYDEWSGDDIEQICQNRGLFTQNRHQFQCYSALAHAEGIEVGVPFLSSDILKIGLSLPVACRSDERGQKPILKRLAARYLPEDIIYASKLGFETPFVDWLCGPLSSSKDILSEDRTLARKIFDPSILARLDPKKTPYLFLAALGFEMFMREFADSK